MRARVLVGCRTFYAAVAPDAASVRRRRVFALQRAHDQREQHADSVGQQVALAAGDLLDRSSPLPGLGHPASRASAWEPVVGLQRKSTNPWPGPDLSREAPYPALTGRC